MHISLGRACRTAVLLCGVITAVATAAALASTYTVDDDKQQCPNAGFTSIQAAVNQAAPRDTIVVCAGTYRESSTPVSSAASPAQPGSHNGLTITKPLNIVGAGADRVIIEPAASAGISLAGTDSNGRAVPYLRDGGGNVVTISRQSLGSTDADENGVNISGVTIESPNAYAEADLAFFNTSGTISNSVIGPIASPSTVGSNVSTEPYGYGIVQSDTLQGAGLGTVRRQVNVMNDLVTGYLAGGILFDDTYAPDATIPVTNSGIISYGYVDHTRVVGNGGTTVGQVGIEYRGGQRGSITSSEITNNLGTATDSRTRIVTNSYGVLLAAADTSAQDPNNTAVPSFFMDGDSVTNNTVGLFNAAIDAGGVAGGETVSIAAPALANGSGGGGGNWWGCSTGPVDIGTTPAAGCQTVSGLNTNTPPTESVTPGILTSAPAALSVPGATTDDAPGVAIVDPLDGSTVTAGTDTAPVVVPTDAFGISSVSLTANGVPVGTVGHTPYVFSWIPSAQEIGTTVTLTATATNAAGAVTSTTIHVNVAAAANYQPITVAPTALAFGAQTVGQTTTKAFAVTDSGTAPLTLTGLTTAGSGFAVAPGSSCTASTTLAPGASCLVNVSFDPVAVAAHAGYVMVSYSAPGSLGPVTVALTGSGVGPAKPTVSGTPVVGKTLTCKTTTPGVSYQWLRGSTSIAKATKSTYKLVAADADSRVSCKVSSGSASATSTSHLVTYPKSTTKTKVTVQGGPVLLTLTRSIKGGSKLTIGTAKLLQATAKTATVTVTGTLKVGKSSYKVSLKKSVARGKTASLTLVLSSKAAKALKAKAGTLKLKIAVRSNTGSKGSVSATLAVKRG